jgi:hypothetical protein
LLALVPKEVASQSKDIAGFVPAVADMGITPVTPST